MTMSKTAVRSLAASLVLAGVAGAAVSVSTSGTLAAFQRPAGAAIADFNADGVADGIIAVDNPDRVLVSFGSAVGFGTPMTIFTGAGTGTRDLAAADIDGNGTIDFVVVLHNINQLRAYMNNGTGVFTPGATATLGSNARGLVSADFNGDSRPDFAIVNRDSNTMSVVLNTAGGFTVATQATGDEPRAAAAGDFDNDGDIDLAATNHRDRSVTVYRNTAGTLSTWTTLSVGGQVRPEGIAGGDLNGDGMADLAVATSGDSANLHFISVFTSQGNAFAGPANFPTLGQDPDSTRLVDLDGDGDLDVITANQSSSNISVFENLGATLSVASLMATGAHPDTIAVGNIAGSTAPDFVVSNRDSDNVSLFVNNASISTCPSDVDNGSGSGTPDGGVTIDDLLYYISLFRSGNAASDMDNGSGTGTPDGGTTIDDLLFYLDRYRTGC